MRFEPRAVELNEMIGQIRAFAAEDVRSAIQISKKYGEKCKIYFGDNKYPQLNFENARIRDKEIEWNASTFGRRVGGGNAG